MNDFGKPKKCSECGKKLRPHPHAGQPRRTCDAECLAERRRRLKREETALARQERREAEYLAEFRRFARGEIP